jgi:PAS domain S-box-containing protein
MANALAAGPGPWSAQQEKAFAAERAIAGVRVAIIVLNTIVYAFPMPKAGTYPTLAYGIIVAANVYGWAYFLAQPYRRFPVMLSSYFSSILDAGFIAVWLYATGGIDSPFFPLWYVSAVAVAFRFGMRETLFAAALYSAAYVALVVAEGQLRGHETVLLVRVAYVGFVSAVGILLTRESTRQIQETIEARALARALRESEARVRTLNDAAFEGIAIHDQGIVIECNVAFARLFGAPREQILGQHALQFIAPESRAVVESHLRTRQDDAYEIVGLRADGTRFPAEVVGRDFPWEGRTVRVTAVRDVTERKRAEEALVEQQVLRAKNDRLREIDRLKTQFINNAAHELATPLTPIKLQSHLLRVERLGPLNDEQKKAVGVVARNVDHLGVLLKDVLDSARLQGGNLVLRAEPVDVSRIAREAVESFAEPARRQGVELWLHAPEPVESTADAARLTQVLFNLLSNALKFTPPGGRVEVKVQPRASDELLVTVRDTGVGLRAEDVPRLFRPFSQVHDEAAQARGGTGLGLFITKGIVEAHGGSVWAESDGPGKGATFSFTLPRARPASSPTAGRVGKTV